jgi:HK97 family phage prohead protease
VKTQPPRDNLYRALMPGPELRDDGDGGMPTLAGHFAVFNEWTEVDSVFEGRFLERIAPGAFAKTIAEGKAGMKVLFQHGRDPQIGDKPLGPIRSLVEDKTGAAYEVPLLDTSYNRDLLPGLKAGLYGASFRFKVTREDFNDTPKRSAYNPDGLPERTITEAAVREFGPVTFPAYSGATAGVRSLTDEFLFERMLRDPDKLRQLIQFLPEAERQDTEDLSTLAEMIMCGSRYIDEQDEPGDEVNIPKMQAILALLTELIPYEVAEPDETDEPEDEGMSSNDEPAELVDAGRAAPDIHVHIDGEKVATAVQGHLDENGNAPATAVADPRVTTAIARREPLYGTRAKKEAPTWRLP